MRRYLFLYAFFTALVVALLVPNAFYLAGSGERDVSAAMETAMTGRRGESCLVGSALRNGWVYKAAGYRIAKPEILALGSSRVMQLRQKFFTAPFFNGGASEERSIYSTREALNAFLTVHEPKLVIVGLDFFWFNAAYTNAKDPLYTKDDAAPGLNKGTLRLLAQPYLWLVQGKITSGDYFRDLTGGSRDAVPCRIGVQAQKLNIGFAADGSHYNIGLIEGDVEAEDVKFSKIRTSIEKGAAGGRFAFGAHADPAALAALKDMMETLKKRHIPAVFFLPPVAPAIRDMTAARGKDFAYIADLRAALKSMPMPVFDFYDPASLPAGDCEFLDGFHGGDLAYARMLLAMAKNPRAAVLRSYTDVPALEKTVGAYKGIALIPGNGFSTKPEVDFMKIGCKK
jgi:hypothetical protein